MSPSHAQSLTHLHHFTGASAGGRYPASGVISSGNRLFGTTVSGGAFDQGSVFAVNRDGTGFTLLHSFVIAEGHQPHGGVILSGSTLYGAAPFGGSHGNGTIFSLSTNGGGFTVLHHFNASAEAPDIFNSPTNNEGANPRALTLVGGTLYGTAPGGGSSGNGTVFRLNTNGTGFAVVHHFAPLFSGFPSTNSEGSTPVSPLLFSGQTLYGSTVRGGSAANGALFSVHTNGTGFANLHSFTTTVNNTNSDGIYPDGQLALSGNTLFGMASQGGAAGNGTLYALHTNGSNFATLHHFTKSPGFPFTITNSDGINPFGGLLVSGNTLFGKTTAGGRQGAGVIFALNLNGSNFTALSNFASNAPPATTNATGYNSLGRLLLSDGALYGTAAEGGLLGFGTLFSLSFPSLTLVRSGTNAVLRWPTNAAGFTLQFTTNLLMPSNWSNASPAPVVVSGQNSVTNPFAGPQKFYRLAK